MINFNVRREYEEVEVVHTNEESKVRFIRGKDQFLSRYVGIKEFPYNQRTINIIKNETMANINLSKITPFIPTVYEFVTDAKSQKVYIVSEFIEGQSLREAINNKTINETQAFWTIEKIVDILDKIQKAYNFLNHRDLKPENILLDRAGNVYLIDFGLTATPLIYGEGTSGYQAPEQRSGKTGETFLKVDQYSIGIIFCELLLGYVPSYGVNFSDRRNPERLFKLEKDLKEKGYSDYFINFILKLLQSKPEKRYRNMEEVKKQIRSFKNNNFGKVKK